MSTGFTLSLSLMALLLHHPGESAPSAGGSEARDCLRRNVPEKMLKELSKMTSDLIKSLPNDNIKHLQLIPKFGKSMKKSKGIIILKEILDFYRDVFRKVSLTAESQKNIPILLSRLGREVEHCLGPYPSVLTSGEGKRIREMRKTFTKLKSHGVSKAIGEFHIVLEWVDSYMHQKKKKQNTEKRQIFSNAENG